MKCIETERLIGYASRLIDESAAVEVRRHLEQCSRCREVVDQHQRLGAVLDEWKAAEPTPGFDARVRQAVDAHEAQQRSRGLWSWDWMRSLALASLGVMIVAGVAWFVRHHHGASHYSQVAARQPQQASPAPTSGRTANAQTPPVAAAVNLTPAPCLPKLDSLTPMSSDEKVAQAMEDYDLAANFDLLSEIPKGEPRVAN
jgi:predicted anti-sigma-YlaC factor YlaD